MKIDEYKCIKCKEIWRFVPEDYDFQELAYPTICPLCNMPITQMIKEVYEEEGIKEVFRRIFIRIKSL